MDKTLFVNRNCVNLNQVTNENKAWVTFLNDNWEQHWFAVTTPTGEHLDWDSEMIMNFCRNNFSRFGIHFGIANTEQMLMGNAMRDNL